MHTLGLLFVTPDRNYFLADGIFVSPDVIVETKSLSIYYFVDTNNSLTSTSRCLASMKIPILFPFVAFIKLVIVIGTIQF